MYTAATLTKTEASLETLCAGCDVGESDIDPANAWRHSRSAQSWVLNAWLKSIVKRMKEILRMFL
jgi:hypothetical protein